MGKLRLSLAIISIVNSAEAGMLARWFGFGGWTSSVLNESTLNASSILVNYSAIGGVNDPDAYAGNGDVKLNLSENNIQSFNDCAVAEIGASSDESRKFSFGQSNVNVDDKIQFENLSATMSNNTSITPPLRVT
jgi:hypothetical protein